jgi:tRNA(Ile)-lysidine synthase
MSSAVDTPANKATPSGAAFAPARLADALAEALARVAPIDRYRVAFSGGADSLALLHGLWALRGRLAPARIDAVHVHHGLHPDADTWAERCQVVCRRLGVDLEVLRVDARPRPGESPEAAARQARYRALSDMLDAGEAVCTAHHQRDQAETLLLQLLRGAGPAGLAAMPAVASLGRGWLVRPILDVGPEALRDYLESHGMGWTEDPGNADRRYDRNFLRHEVMPRLMDRWPGAQRTLARAAAHQADGMAVADALARLDLDAARDPRTGTLSLPALTALPAPRARNLLRGWLAERGLPAAGAVHLQEILDGLVSARNDAMPLVTWPGAEVRRHRDALHAQAPLPSHDPDRVLPWVPGEALELPHGELDATLAEGRGLRAAPSMGARVEVRFRRGGERFRPVGRRHSTTLKKLLQASDLPPWLRERVPLVYIDDELAAVAGMWVAEAHAAGGRDSGWVLRWSALPDTIA